MVLDMLEKDGGVGVQVNGLLKRLSVVVGAVSNRYLAFLKNNITVSRIMNPL